MTLVSILQLKALFETVISKQACSQIVAAVGIIHCINPLSRMIFLRIENMKDFVRTCI